ncbi:MAG: hypothetical protein AB7Q00_06525 [Phycisphaerales bacterium]|nr:MAG: hypothetical protein IPK69_11215 [Phycisphaerales bacterium]
MWTLAASPQWLPFLVVGGMFGIVATIILATVMNKRRWRREMSERCMALGGTFIEKPQDHEKHEAFLCVGPWQKLQTGSRGVQWLATVPLSILPHGTTNVRMLGHLYSTGSGKNRQVHIHTIAWLEAPRAWPILSVYGEHFMHRLADKFGLTERFGKKDLQLDDAEFNKRYRVNCDDEDFALLALTPEAQRWCMNLPKDKGQLRVDVGQGAICVTIRRTPKPAELEDFARRVVEIRDLIPPELASFTPTSSATLM